MYDKMRQVGTLEELNKAPTHEPIGCPDCQYWLEEYGAVLVDATKNPARHRGWFEGVHERAYYQKISAP